MISNELFERAQQHIPGGVNSPVRAFKSVGGTPLFIQHAEGAYIVDADGKQYIDYVGSWGPLILGHNHPGVKKAIEEQLQHGLTYGAPCLLEIELASKISELMPTLELVRMVNSGTEATMSAIRLARGFTGRDKFIKFTGCYHGHSDALLVAAGSGALTLGVPSSAGVPESMVQHTLLASYNDLDSVQSLFEKYPDDIAAIIVEPVAGNMNCIPPRAGFLQGLRKLCDQFNAVLIFDEVMTGFRVAAGGAQALYQVKPDLTTLGKIIGGGLPVGAFGGRKEIMEFIAPLGPVYQAGTLSGNPIAMAAGLATLEAISSNPNFYNELSVKTQYLLEGIEERAKHANISFVTNSVGAMFGLFFTAEGEPAFYQQVMACNQEQFKQFFHGMLQQGIYLAPSAYEAGFVSSAHHDEEIKLTLDAAERVFASMKLMA